MTLTVHKYDVPIAGSLELNLPRGAQLLRFAAQRGVPQLWALVDPAAPRAMRLFRLVGTGHPIDSEGRLAYIGTTEMLNGDLIFHLFEVLP